MGTNYYIMKKADYEKEKRFYDMENNFNDETYKETIEKIVKENSMYKEILKLYGKDSYELEKLEYNVKEFIQDTNYRFEDIFRVHSWNSDKIHIGKASYGWLFGFQDSEFWHSYKEFKEFIMNISDEWIIIDEYSEEITNKGILKIIDEKQKDKYSLENTDNFKYDRNVDGYRFISTDFS